MMDTEGKYVTFKREDLFQYLGKFLPQGEEDCAPVAAEIIKEVADIELADAVVIRTHDVYAGPALHAYTGAVLSAAEMMPACPERESLLGISDYMHDRAVEADEARRTNVSKLPD